MRGLFLWEIIGINHGIRPSRQSTAACGAGCHRRVRSSKTTAYVSFATLSTQRMTSLPDRMTVIAIRQPGGPEVLVPEPRPVPDPAAGEILVKVGAAGVNRPDAMQRMGLYPPPP